MSDRYARIPMPWAHRGPRFLSPSYHRIDAERIVTTRCGMPVPKRIYESALPLGKLLNFYHPLTPKICKTCDGMAQPNGKRPAHLRGTAK